MLKLKVGDIKKPKFKRICMLKNFEVKLHISNEEK
jgi:hypothetical protein